MTGKDGDAGERETPVIRESVHPVCDAVEVMGKTFLKAPSGRELRRRR